ncbi:MAG: glycosyl hydrolase family 18 protein [Patescibacteria group bacterium]
MKHETKLTLFIFLIVILMGSAGFIIEREISGKSVLSPFSRSVNIFSLFGIAEKPKRIIYGYLPYWSIENSEYLQLDKLTHIAYFGLYLNPDGSFMETTLGEDDSIITEPAKNNWENNDELSKLIRKASRRDIRFALTVIAHIDEDIDAFLDCRSCWDTLLNNLRTELDKKDITDVNLNFEYAGFTEEDKQEKFVELTKFLNEELDKTYEDSFLVVSAFADSIEEKRVSSKLEKLGKAADAIFIMGYDFHRPQSDSVGPVAPIEGPGFNITQMLKEHLSKVPPNKVILGVPYYGYNWIVEDDSEYAKRIDGSDLNGFSQSQSYETVLETIIEVDPILKWNEEGKAPYFTYVSPETASLRTAYYENADSLAVKYDLINQNNLAGVGIWALGYDGGYTELWDLLYEKFIK